MAPPSLKKMSRGRGEKEGNYASSDTTHSSSGRYANCDLGLTLLPGSQISLDEDANNDAVSNSTTGAGSGLVNAFYRPEEVGPRVLLKQGEEKRRSQQVPDKCDSCNICIEPALNDDLCVELVKDSQTLSPDQSRSHEDASEVQINKTCEIASNVSDNLERFRQTSSRNSISVLSEARSQRGSALCSVQFANYGRKKRKISKSKTGSDPEEKRFSKTLVNGSTSTTEIDDIDPSTILSTKKSRERSHSEPFKTPKNRGEHSEILVTDLEPLCLVTASQDHDTVNTNLLPKRPKDPPSITRTSFPATSCSIPSSTGIFTILPQHPSLKCSEHLYPQLDLDQDNTVVSHINTQNQTSRKRSTSLPNIHSTFLPTIMDAHRYQPWPTPPSEPRSYASYFHGPSPSSRLNVDVTKHNNLSAYSKPSIAGQSSLPATAQLYRGQDNPESPLDQLPPSLIALPSADHFQNYGLTPNHNQEINDPSNPLSIDDWSGFFNEEGSPVIQHFSQKPTSQNDHNPLQLPNLLDGANGSVGNEGSRYDSHQRKANQEIMELRSSLKKANEKIRELEASTSGWERVAIQSQQSYQVLQQQSQHFWTQQNQTTSFLNQQTNALRNENTTLRTANARLQESCKTLVSKLRAVATRSRPVENIANHLLQKHSPDSAHAPVAGLESGDLTQAGSSTQATSLPASSANTESATISHGFPSLFTPPTFVQPQVLQTQQNLITGDSPSIAQSPPHQAFDRYPTEYLTGQNGASPLKDSIDLTEDSPPCSPSQNNPILNRQEPSEQVPGKQVEGTSSGRSSISQQSPQCSSSQRSNIAAAQAARPKSKSPPNPDAAEDWKRVMADAKNGKCGLPKAPVYQQTRRAIAPVNAIAPDSRDDAAQTQPSKKQRKESLTKVKEVLDPEELRRQKKEKQKIYRQTHLAKKKAQRELEEQLSSQNPNVVAAASQSLKHARREHKEEIRQKQASQKRYQNGTTESSFSAWSGNSDHDSLFEDDGTETTQDTAMQDIGPATNDGKGAESDDDEQSSRHTDHDDPLAAAFDQAYREMMEEEGLEAPMDEAESEESEEE